MSAFNKNKKKIQVALISSDNLCGTRARPELPLFNLTAAESADPAFGGFFCGSVYSLDSSGLTIGFRVGAATRVEPYLVVYCELKDCVYYRPEPASASQCRCVHPDKAAYNKTVHCPLYRMDWQKKLKSIAPETKKPRAKYED